MFIKIIHPDGEDEILDCYFTFYRSEPDVGAPEEAELMCALDKNGKDVMDKLTRDQIRNFEGQFLKSKGY